MIDLTAFAKDQTWRSDLNPQNTIRITKAEHEYISYSWNSQPVRSTSYVSFNSMVVRGDFRCLTAHGKGKTS